MAGMIRGYTTLEWILCVSLLFSQQRMFALAKTNHVPQFTQEITVGTINENQDPGAHIARVSAVDYDGDKIQYAIQGDTNGFFSINSDNGEILTAKPIDLEKLPSEKIEFEVIASEVKRPDQKASHNIHVIVLDLNDNEPQFPKELQNQIINITENVAHGTFVTKMKATDADKDDDLFYSFASGNELKHFKIIRDTGRVEVAMKLDYEFQKTYKLVVAVMDGRPNEKGAHTVTTTLVINIIDEDDNGAKFDRNYSLSVTEGIKKEAFLTKVHAEDQDKGINMPVHYYIEKVSNQDNLFSINKDGDVFVNGEIDREKNPIYTLQLRAVEDSSQESFQKNAPAKATLTIVVVDVNDNVPKFSLPKYIGYVTEHEEIGHKIIKVLAIDIDEGEHAKFSYRLSGSQSSSFSISPDGDLIVESDIDREKNLLFNFKVEAVQNGQSKQSSEAEVTVIVRDKNDHSPIFIESSYSVTVAENLKFNSTVIMVSATDKDFEKNGEICYSIAPGDADGSCFRIDVVTGKIRLMCKLDREEKEHYAFLAQASDSNTNGNERSGHAQVKVHVKDLNDNAPVFASTEYFKSINYDEDVGATIIKLTATDKDTGSFSKVSYKIVSGNEEKKFLVKKDSGALLVGRSLADVFGEFKIGIEAYDNDGEQPSLHSAKNAYVTIKVEKNGFNSVVLYMKKKISVILHEKHNIERSLQDILDIGIKTDYIEIGDGKDVTKYIFHAYNKESYAVIKWSEVISTLQHTKKTVLSHFINTWNVTYWEKHGKVKTEPEKQKQSDDTTKTPETWTPIIYAVLGFSALIVIFGIIGIVYLIRSRRRFDDGGTSQTSSRVPITARHRSRSYWNDPGFESVSQINTESYVHSSGFLAGSCDKYELDPSNLYNKDQMYQDDPFSVIIDRPPSSSRSDDNSSNASSGFAASSVMTVYRAPNACPAPGVSQPLLNPYKPTAGRNGVGVSPRERKLSVIVDEDGNSRMERPPSYEYDFDEKVPDDYN